MWYTLLHRTDNFDNTTPKYLFEQQEVYMKVNGLSKNDKSKVKEEKKLDKVEDFF
ncbi:hypothetical protein [Romboutsia ilealis]|uniref:hypothetical protein n=1 Tax=Romboutsia ilealis TaxID=1115758 RepID=UPI002731033B|nr:hypothetical protein [Romboutsia ilealis]